MLLRTERWQPSRSRLPRWLGGEAGTAQPGSGRLSSRAKPRPRPGAVVWRGAPVAGATRLAAGRPFPPLRWLGGETREARPRFEPRPRAGGYSGGGAPAAEGRGSDAGNVGHGGQWRAVVPAAAVLSITAEAVAVRGFEELEMLGRQKVQGKIVVYNEPWEGYGQPRAYRGSGASRAAALGSVAALIRSATPLAMQEPHTGSMNYAPDQPKIPAAAISVEDAALIWRLYSQGISVQVHLEMSAHMEPDADSADVIGEIPGGELPDEVVVMGGHIDSWDVGQGAQDDGAGILAPYEAAVLIKKLGLKPRRTIRVVFWVNEENGGRGGEAYRDWVRDKVSSHVAAIEMDSGSETPRGLGFSGSSASLVLVQQVARVLDRIGAGRITTGGSEAGIEPLLRLGVPGLSVQTTTEHYFDWHHSQADTLDKVNPEDFRKNTAVLAVMAYVLADMPGKLSGSSQ
jgi:carboxypeptidase Q